MSSRRRQDAAEPPNAAPDAVAQEAAPEVIAPTGAAPAPSSAEPSGEAPYPITPPTEPRPIDKMGRALGEDGLPLSLVERLRDQSQEN